ncbi:MAG TPA: hypothetical protein PKM35_04705 [Holophaga sp.]|nr:hypothetical protein [Holophaga sp.]HPS67395.1 hypothetical protein [Holophaga sp.]
MAKFQSLWIGKALSPLEILCIRSFLVHGHEFELYAYEELRGLPEGCTLRDAGAIQPREQVFRYRDGHGKGSPAGFANLFRYKLLAEKGGWWVDTDVLCLASDLPEAEVVFAPEEPGRYNVAIMKFPAGHPLMDWLYTTATTMGRGVLFGQTGPDLMTRGIHANGMQHLASPQDSFYPIHYSQAKQVLDPRARNTVATSVQGATFLHLWNEMLRRMHYAKTVAPPSGSYLRACFEHHGMIEAFKREYFVTRRGEKVCLDVRTRRDSAGGACGRFAGRLGDWILLHCDPTRKRVRLARTAVED